MKIPFLIEKTFNKIFKPQIVTIVETFIDGKKQKTFYGKSLTANFLQMLYAQFNNNDVDFATSPAPFGNSRVNAQNSAGALVDGKSTMQIQAGTGVTNQGICVGSGSGAVAPANFNLGTLIANGVGVGQLQYQNQISTQGTVISGSNSSFVLERLYINGSGGNVTVNELGIFVNNAGQFLIYRDLVSPGDSIPNGSTYRVAITFQITT